MLKAREADDETMHLVEQAARGLINTVDAQGSEAVMDWEVIVLEFETKRFFYFN